MEILFFGTYNATVHPRVAVLREGLGALGHTVEECNSPIGVSTSERVRMLHRPWEAVVFFARMLRAWLDLWRWGRRHRSVDAVVVGYLGIFDVHLARLLWREQVVVLDHLAPSGETAEDRGSGALVQRILEWVDEAALKSSDVVCVDTPAHLPDVASAADRVDGVVVRVGAPSRWFSPPDELPPDPLRVIFFGLYTPLQGAPVIGEAIRLLADEGVALQLTMVGGGQQRAETMRRAGTVADVHWIDWVPPNELPAMASQHHVCLGIFGASEKARKVVPNKVYQGSAAGCAVVTSDTGPQREVLGDAAWYVQPGDSRGLSEVLGKLTEDPAIVEELRWKAFDLADRDFRPEAVVRPIDRLLRNELDLRGKRRFSG